MHADQWRPYPLCEFKDHMNITFHWQDLCLGTCPPAHCWCSISCFLMNLSSMLPIAQRPTLISWIFSAWRNMAKYLLFSLLTWLKLPSGKRASQGSLSFQRSHSPGQSSLVQDDLLSESFYSSFFLLLPFSSFDNTESLESKLVGLNLDRGDCTKSSRNLVGKPCFLRPLFTALSFNVIMVAGKK